MALADRIAVLGLGRSGLAVARAARRRGASVVVFDEQIRDAIAKPDIAEDAEREGIDVRYGWQGEFETGIGLLVSNPAIPKTHRALAAARAAGIEVASEVEFAYRISRAPIVAITGTNGKSTSTVMTYLALRAADLAPVLCGNIFGSGYPEVPLTEAADASEPHQTLVAEISSFQLEQVSTFRPVAAGITNISDDHLDRYESFADYAATKQRIFAAQTSADFAVVRAHDPVVRAPKGPTVFRFGATAEDAHVEEDALSFWNRRVPLSRFKFTEPHNASNAAFAALLAYGAIRSRSATDPEAKRMLDAALAAATPKASVYRRTTPPVHAMPDAVIEGLAEFDHIAHRMEYVGTRNGVRIINNSMCTNPDAVIKSAQAVKDPVHLLIGGANKGLNFMPLRNYLANGRNHAYLFGTAASELNEMLGGRYPVFTTMAEAFAAAAAKAVDGEVVMLAPGCASTDQFRDFRERGDVFTQIAKEWLNP